MKCLLILYPYQFKSFSKFYRKLSRILEKYHDFYVIFPRDPNGFIRTFFNERFPNVTLKEDKDWDIDIVTHAIVFDDGEEFLDEIREIKNRNIPLREIKILITRVINIKKETKFKDITSTNEYEYIGRGSYWGNPYPIHDNGDDRETVIAKFKYDFDFDKFANKKKSEVYKLAGKRLGCFCKPEKCHGDVLADYLNSLDDNK